MTNIQSYALININMYKYAYHDMYEFKSFTPDNLKPIPKFSSLQRVKHGGSQVFGDHKLCRLEV